jgi:hypothetical protein
MSRITAVLANKKNRGFSLLAIVPPRTLMRILASGGVRLTFTGGAHILFAFARGLPNYYELGAAPQARLELPQILIYAGIVSQGGTCVRVLTDVSRRSFLAQFE